MKPIKYDTIAPTKPDDIIMDNIYVGSKGLIKYNHPKYGKKHVLLIRASVCKLNQFPIEHYIKCSNTTENIPISLKIPIDSNFIKDSFYMFIQNILTKYECLVNPPKIKYPFFDNTKVENYIKIKEMNKFNYTVIEVINKDDLKPKTIIHKPSNLKDLQIIFKSYSYVVPYVMLYYHKTELGDFITLKPVKFYVGNNLNMDVIDYISRKTRISEIPKSEFFDANQTGKPVLLDDFLKFVKEDNIIC